MRLKLPRALAVAVAATLVVTAAAAAVTIKGEYGDSIVRASAEIAPHKLPAKRLAPVSLTTALHVRQRNGKQPAALKTVVFQVDKHGSLARKGVPVCTMKKLEGLKPKQARKRCAGALVGTGVGKARVTLPGQATVTISSPLSLFNGPLVGGRPSLIAHAYETLPTPQALLIPIVIQRVHHGRYGFQAKVQLPPIAEGYGAATVAEAKIGRVYNRHGRKFGYFNASCSGGRLQVHGTLSFANGDLAPTTLVTPCQVSG